MIYEPLFELTIGSHFFRVNKLAVRAERIITDFAYRFVKYGIVRQPMGRFQREPVSVFAASNTGRTEFRFHINALEEFRAFLRERFVTPNLITETALPIPEAKELNLTVKSEWVPYDYQIPVIEYLGAPPPPRAKFVGIQTGKGKSLSGTIGMCNFNKRTVVFIKPMYIQKWVDDFEKYTDVDKKKKEIMTIRGSAQLMALLQMAADGMIDHLKIIIVSNKTMQEWIKEYEKIGERAMREQGYACTPEQFCAHISAGLRLVDEVHQDLHLNMKIDLYTHIERSFSLSATMLNMDAFIKKMQDLMYPPAERFDGGELDKYIEAIAYLYHIKQHRQYRTSEFNSPTYSHIAFERSIMKNRDFMLSYFSMIKSIIDQSFMQTKKANEKFRVFVSSIAMATALTNFLAEAYPKLRVERYVEDDEYENLLEADLGVTTVLSGGTAHDIPNLLGLLMTIALDSLQANIQVMGRLRKLKESQVFFYYLSCMDIPKQMQFHERKLPMLHERAKSLKVVLAQESV